MQIRHRIGDSPSVGNRGGASQPAGAGSINWLYRDEFTTANGPPATTPRVKEPGPGNFTLVQTDGQYTIAADELDEPIQTTAAWGDQGFHDAVGWSRKIGRTLFTEFTATDLLEGKVLCWFSSAALPLSQPAQDHSFYLATSLGVANVASQLFSLGYVLSTGVSYKLAIALRSTGAWFFVKGGVFTTWFLFWVDTTGSTATLFTGAENFNYALKRKYMRLRDVPQLTNDYSMAIHQSTADLTAFGANVVVNGNAPIAFSGGNPTSWNTDEVPPDPEVTEVASGNLHGAGGTGAINFFNASATPNQPRINQAVLTINTYYETKINLSARGALGNMAISGWSSWTSTGIKKSYARAASTTLLVFLVGVSGDMTMDSVEAYPMTLDPPVTTLADGMFEVLFTSPASPLAGDQFEMRYRRKDDDNFWRSRVFRNEANTSFTHNVDSVFAGTPTQRATATGIANVRGLRTTALGNQHETFRLSTANFWSRLGSGVSQSVHNTETGYQILHTSGWTVVDKVVWPLNPSGMDVELDRTA